MMANTVYYLFRLAAVISIIIVTIMQSPPPRSTAEEGHAEQDLGLLIPIYIAATVFGLIVLSFFVRIILWVYRSVKASLPPHASARVVALHQLALVS